MSTTDDIPAGPGIATLVVAMPGTVRPPTLVATAMLEWLHHHGAPRSADVLERLQRKGWTVEAAEPDAATQFELIARARFPDVEQALAAAGPYHGRVNELMRWAPADHPDDEVLLPVSEEPAQ